MRKIFYALTVLSAVALVGTSCRRDWADDPNPTAPGYAMCANNLLAMRALAADLDMLFAADLYLQAATDAERHDIHEQYFYNHYLYTEGDALVIRYQLGSSRYGDIKILTGGGSLAEAGTEWRMLREEYNPSTGKNDVVESSLRHIAGNEYKVEFPQAGVAECNPLSAAHSLDILTATSAGRLDYIISGASTVQCEGDAANERTFTVEAVAIEAQWSGGKSRFVSGRHILISRNSSTVDEATADYNQDGSVTVTYDGFSKDYH